MASAREILEGLPASASLLYIVALLSWTSISITPYPSVLYRKYFPTQFALDQMCSSLGLCFAPGLLDVLNAAAPPSIAWFMQLPSGEAMEFRRCWGVYLLVLQKPGCRDCIYIGSGTDYNHGVRNRLKSYDYIHSNIDVMPEYVLDAIDRGYTITSKGLLTWCPTPPFVSHLIVRVLILAIEAFFSFAFWAMRVPFDGDDSYGGMDAMCL